MRRDGDLDPLRMALAVAREAHVPISKADEGLYPLQDGLYPSSIDGSLCA
jgi:hypothetical protein